MGFTYAILGAGRQGVAMAYDLAKNGEAERIILADLSPEVAAKGAVRLGELLKGSKCLFEPVECDVADRNSASKIMHGVDVVVSAVPYKYNFALTEIAIEAGASFCDLGGNTQVVRTQVHRNPEARAAGVSIIPDCGLAPGLGNHLAAHGIGSMDEPEHVHIRCGGLPEKKVGPLNYKLLFNFQGLVNEYSGVGEFLRDGRRVDVPTLTELEEIEFPQPVGRCEAAVTSGGTSTAPETFLGRLKSYDYKTVRYPGHFSIIKAMFELGFFEEEVILADGTLLYPKATTRRLMEEKLQFPDVRDITVLRVVVKGKHNGKPKTIQYELIDRHDEATGFTAMERTTGFPAALVAYMQARKIINPGVRPLEVSVPAKQFLDELPTHGINVNITE